MTHKITPSIHEIKQLKEEHRKFYWKVIKRDGKLIKTENTGSEKTNGNYPMERSMEEQLL